MLWENGRLLEILGFCHFSYLHTFEVSMLKMSEKFTKGNSNFYERRGGSRCLLENYIKIPYSDDIFLSN